MSSAKGTFTRAAFTGARDKATDGGRKSATADAEEQHRSGKGLNPLVDPKGLPGSSIGPVRLSLPRLVQRDHDKLWELTNGEPMLEETLLDTTGSMRDNVEIAFGVLPDSYDLMTSGSHPVLGKYDVQIINACFGDTEDQGTPILCRSQAEMDVKIAQQVAMLVPSKDGRGNGKEDPQFGIFGAAYLTSAWINKYGLKYYHFTVSDEPVFDTIDHDWLKRIFGGDVIKRAVENGYEMSARGLPDTAQAVKDLQKNAHAFFLQVGNRPDVTRQWTKLYGAEHIISIASGTEFLHFVKACIIGLTEGVLDLGSTHSFLRDHKVSMADAKDIVRSLAHIPLGAQTCLPNFNRLPKVGDLFREKTDLWPIDPTEIKPGKPPANKKKPGDAEWL